MIILQGKGLSKYYVTDLIFQNVDFYIQENEKVALVGPNGAGKTTFAALSVRKILTLVN